MDGDRAGHREVAGAIGLRLAGLRRQLGMSREAVAAGAGLSVEKVEGIENGVGELDCSILLRLAGALEVPEKLLMIGLKWQPVQGTFEIPDPPAHYIAGR